MSTTLDIIIETAGALLRFIGLLVLGLGLGWLVLEFFRKGTRTWQLQAAIILGALGAVVGMTKYASPAALGGFALGLGAALLVWGMREEKEEKEEKQE